MPIIGILLQVRVGPLAFLAANGFHSSRIFDLYVSLHPVFSPSSIFFPPLLIDSFVLFSSSFLNSSILSFFFLYSTCSFSSPFLTSKCMSFLSSCFAALGTFATTDTHVLGSVQNLIDRYVLYTARQQSAQHYFWYGIKAADYNSYLNEFNPLS